jgi:hypothetical protein
MGFWGAEWVEDTGHWGVPVPTLFFVNLFNEGLTGLSASHNVT